MGKLVFIVMCIVRLLVFLSVFSEFKCFFLCPTGQQAVRVTKPNIPESIRRNYELM